MKSLFDDSGPEKLQATLSDIAEDKTFLTCQKHMYTPGPHRMPTSGCADCWRVLYWTMFAKLGPERGREWIEGLEAAIHHATEQVEKGTWDFEPLLTPHLDIEGEEAADVEYFE